MTSTSKCKTMYDQAHPSHPSDDMPTEPGWYATRDGEDLLSYDGDAWHIHNIDCDAQLFVDGDLETMDWSVVKRTFDADAFPLIPVNLNDTSRAERRLTNLTNFCTRSFMSVRQCGTTHLPTSIRKTSRMPSAGRESTSAKTCLHDWKTGCSTMNVHDHITDWQHLPSSFLAGKRAIATTVEGTTIDGFLQSMTTKFSNGSGSMVQLFFGGVFQPVIISLNGGENQLCRAYDSILILNEVKR